MATYTPKQFGELIGKTTQTLQRWDRLGILTAYRTPTNRRFYTHEQYLQVVRQMSEKETVAYCRTSTSESIDDMKMQIQKTAIQAYSVGAKKTVTQWLSDVGSGIDYDRPDFNKLMRLIEADRVNEIIVTQLDRVGRGPLSWFMNFCKHHNVKISVVDINTATAREVVDDFSVLLDQLAQQLPGLSKHKEQIIALAKDETSSAE